MNNTFTITLSQEDLNLVLGALQELPAKIANPVTNRIIPQLQKPAEQITAG